MTHDRVIPGSNCCIMPQRPNALPLSMGPVSMAVVMYAGERLLTRLVSGQLLRKGIARKIRRLTKMVLDWHVIEQIVNDYLEDSM